MFRLIFCWLKFSIFFWLSERDVSTSESSSGAFGHPFDPIIFEATWVGPDMKCHDIIGKYWELYVQFFNGGNLTGMMIPWEFLNSMS